MKEAGVLIDVNDQPIFWHVPSDRSIVTLPDSRQLWDVIWDKRDVVKGFAHTHPGSGAPIPSMEDLTTFRAIELALGKQLLWWVATSDHISSWLFYTQAKRYMGERVAPDPTWLVQLRVYSGGMS